MIFREVESNSFVHRRFVGIEPMVHCHALPGEEAAVFVLFNLGSEPLEQEVSVPLRDISVRTLHSARGANARIEQTRLCFEVEIPPLSPWLVEINTPS